MTLDDAILTYLSAYYVGQWVGRRGKQPPFKVDRVETEIATVDYDEPFFTLFSCDIPPRRRKVYIHQQMPQTYPECPVTPS